MRDRVRTVEALYNQPVTEDHTSLGPLTECLCGSDLFITCMWLDDDKDCGGWFVDGKCAQCGAAVLIATPADQVMLDDEGQVRYL